MQTAVSHFDVCLIFPFFSFYICRSYKREVSHKEKKVQKVSALPHHMFISVYIHVWCIPTYCLALLFRLHNLSFYIWRKQSCSVEPRGSRSLEGLFYVVLAFPFALEGCVLHELAAGARK